eukprot:SM000017S02749  [mRNA]  locus=s17:12487:13826:- [translate_table: standard]
MASAKETAQAALAAADKIKARTLDAARGLSRAQAERAATAAARNVNAYGQKEEGPSRWQERKEAKRQMYLMSTERAVVVTRKDDKKGDGGGTQQCQKCLKLGHWTYECKNDRVYASRPTRTQQLKHPRLRQRALDPAEGPPLDARSLEREGLRLQALKDEERRVKKAAAAAAKKRRRKAKDDSDSESESESESDSELSSESESASSSASDSESQSDSETESESESESESNRRRHKQRSSGKGKSRVSKVGSKKRSRRSPSESESESESDSGSSSESESDSGSPEDKRSQRRGKKAVLSSKSKANGAAKAVPNGKANGKSRMSKSDNEIADSDSK